MKKPWTHLEGIAVHDEARQDVHKVPRHLCAVAAMPIKHAKEAGGLGTPQVLLDNESVLQGSYTAAIFSPTSLDLCLPVMITIRQRSIPDSVLGGRADPLLLLTSRHTAP